MLDILDLIEMAVRQDLHLPGRHDQRDHGRKAGKRLMGEILNRGGFTYQPLLREVPTRGYSVSIFPELERAIRREDLTPAHIDRFKERHAELLRAHPGAHLGGWFDQENGIIYLDIAVIVPSRLQAYKLAIRHGQEGFYDLERDETVLAKRAEQRRRTTNKALHPVCVRSADVLAGDLRGDHEGNSTQEGLKPPREPGSFPPASANNIAGATPGVLYPRQHSGIVCNRPASAAPAVLSTRASRASCLESRAGHTGAMVALYPPESVTRQIVLGDETEGGVPEGELHCTLAYLGEASALNPGKWDEVRAALQKWAREQRPLQAKIAGVGHFTQDEGEGRVAHVLNVDAPALPRLRQDLVEYLHGLDVHENQEHGFTPHVTRAYAAPDADYPDPPVVEFTFDTLSLCVAERRDDYPLGNESEPPDRPKRQALAFSPLPRLDFHLPGKHNQQDHAPYKARKTAALREMAARVKARVAAGFDNPTDAGDVGALVKRGMAEALAPYERRLAQAQERSDRSARQLDKLALGKLSGEQLDRLIERHMRAVAGELEARTKRNEVRDRLLHEALAAIRPMGPGPAGIAWGKGSDPDSRHHVEGVASRYPTAWWQASNGVGPLKAGVSKDSRGYYQHATGELALSGRPSAERDVAIHELGHRFEHTVPKALDMAQEFYRRRTAGEQPRPLGAGYEPSERTRPDRFFDPYVGKVYRSGGTEVLSMGLEATLGGRYSGAIARQDPGHELFTLGLLAGL